MSRAYPGWHFEWVGETTEGGLAWRLADETEHRFCRYMSGGKVCGRPAVAAILRGTKRRSWWFYCDNHLYGRRIANGRVEHQCLVPDGTAGGETG